MEQEPWWKRQEREARERNQTLKEESKEKKQRKKEEKQTLKEEQERMEKEQDKRPESIKNFEQFYLISLFAGFFISMKSPEKLFEGMPWYFEVGFPIIILGIIALLVLHASRNQNNIAKWIVVIVAGFSILSAILFIPELVSGLVSLSLLEISQTFQLICFCVAIKYAFTKESRDWFAGIPIENNGVEVS